MTSKQLLKLILENRELLQRSHHHAYDSLQLLKNKYADFDDEEVRLNLELNDSLAEVQFNSAYDKVIEKSLRIIEQYQNTTYRYPYYRHFAVIGRCYANIGEFQKAEDCLLFALEHIENETGEFTWLKADLLHLLTMNEQIAERGPEKSIGYLTQAIELLKDVNSIQKANILMALGNVYINDKQVEKALENYHAAALTFEHHFDLNNMGHVYCNLGTAYLTREDFDEALRYFEKSLDLRKKVGSPEHLSISYYNMGLLYRGKRELDKAEEMLLKCRDLIVRTNNKPFLKDTDEELAKIAALKQERKVA